MTEHSPENDSEASRPRLDGALALHLTGLNRPDGEPSGVPLLSELESTVADNLNRHHRQAKVWNPHDYVPWSKGRDFAFLGGEDWDPTQSSLDELAKSAMILNLLTEDNLPSYHRVIATTFGRDGAWGQWVGRWTAEEGRHAMAMRDYLVVTRGVDPVALEQARMSHMTEGYDDGDRDALHTIAYVTFQELATRVSHRATGKACQDPIADKLLQRIAMDENLHMVFYRNLVDATFDMAPNQMMRAVADEVMGFEMPGANIQDFRRMALIIANGEIYDPNSHYSQVIMPVLKHWRVFEREGLSGDGEAARQELADFVVKLEKKAARFVENQARRAARSALES